MISAYNVLMLLVGWDDSIAKVSF